MKKVYSITVKGKSHRFYSFDFIGDDEFVDQWREEGFEIDEICNTIPQWVVNLRLTKVLVFLQDYGIIKYGK